MNTRRPDAGAGTGRVLVVDHNAWTEMLLRMLLENAGHVVLGAAGGREALVLADGFRPQLVFIDLDLPDVDSLSLARQLKRRAGAREAVIVALAARDLEASEARNLEARVVDAGCAGLLTKPLDLSSFHETVRGFLGARGR